MSTDFRNAVEQVIADARYIKNVEYDNAQTGHPEQSVKHHIAELEANLEKINHLLPNSDLYWKLKFLIHTHDLCKADAIAGVQAGAPGSHQKLARTLASYFTNDPDILNIIQYHDENYILWQQYRCNGQFNKHQFATLLNLIQDWDLYLAFTIIDGKTPGKEIERLPWFIDLVKQYRPTLVDVTWI